jgi:hypothetical protein
MAKLVYGAITSLDLAPLTRRGRRDAHGQADSHRSTVIKRRP